MIGFVITVLVVLGVGTWVVSMYNGITMGEAVKVIVDTTVSVVQEGIKWVQKLLK